MKNGEVIRATIFEPLLQMLSPAFKAGAEKISINYSKVGPRHISAKYSKGGKNFPLDIKTTFGPADVFVRVRIIAGISIAAEGRLSGNITMRFKGDDVGVFLEIITNENEETIHFKCGSE